MIAKPDKDAAPDYDEITRVIQLYFDGWKGDINKFREAFHEDAWIFFTNGEGVFRACPLTERFEPWVAANRQMKGDIISVTQAGDVASVLLRLDNTADPSDTWVDIHALQRIDGIWKITNKTAVHSSQGGWAGK